MGETFELFVGCFHLVVLGVENDRLLDVEQVLLSQMVISHTQLLDAEIRP